MDRPVNGRHFARLRLSLGLSLSQVAAAMGTTHHSNQRWEQSQAPVASGRAQLWEAALRDLAAERTVALAQQGFRKQDLPLGLRRAIAALQGR